jgi:hypothetical protein
MPWFGILSACSGSLYSITDPSVDPDQYKHKKGYQGILVYAPTNFVEISWLTAVLDNKGKIERTYKGDKPENKCQIRLQYKHVVRPDYDRPYQLLYAPGLLEKYNFKAEFEQGMLKSVGVDSSPDRGETFKNLATAAAEAGKTMTAGLLPDQHPCTHEPVLKYVRKLKDVCANDVCNWDKYEPEVEQHRPIIPSM